MSVIPNAATLVADTRHKGHFRHSPRFRSRPQSIVCNADDFTLGRFSECAQEPFSVLVLSQPQAFRAGAHKRPIQLRCKFAIGQVDAENVEIKDMELVIVLVIKCLDRITFVCLECFDCTLNHCLRLCLRAEFLRPVLPMPPNRADAANTHASKFLPMAIPPAFL